MTENENKIGNNLKIDLSKIDDNNVLKHDKKIPLSAPVRLLTVNNKRTKLIKKKVAMTTRNHIKEKKKFHYFSKVPDTPRLDELPLTLRLHSNPILLIQSLRLQGIMTKNMNNIPTALDNKLPNNLLTYAKRRKKIREKDPHPELNVPTFLKKQMKFETLNDLIIKQKQHRQRINDMRGVIDNKLPKNIQTYRKIRRNRLKTAQQRAKLLHEKRIKKQYIGKENKNYLSRVLHINDKIAKKNKFIKSPKKSKNDKKVLIEALPCHFNEWK